MAKAPNWKDKGYKDIDIDIFALYNNNNKKAALKAAGQVPKGRRMDEDERAYYIEEQKAKLDLQDMLDQSSKRSQVGEQLYSDMPYLEFT